LFINDLELQTSTFGVRGASWEVFVTWHNSVRILRSSERLCFCVLGLLPSIVSIFLRLPLPAVVHLTLLLTRIIPRHWSLSRICGASGGAYFL
jgi:hypothetical protein